MAEVISQGKIIKAVLVLGSDFPCCIEITGALNVTGLLFKESMFVVYRLN